MAEYQLVLDERLHELERVEAGVLQLSEQPGRPIGLEPHWTTGSLESAVQECLAQGGRISCRYQDGRAGVVIGEQTVRAPQVIAGEYEVTLDSVPIVEPSGV